MTDLTLEGLCVNVLQAAGWWIEPPHEGGLTATYTWSNHTVTEEQFTYPPKYSEREGMTDRQIRNTQAEKTAYIAGWLETLVGQFGIQGWVVGNGSLCHMTDAMAVKLDIKNIKHRRKQVYSICLEEVNPHDPKPCGKPIYDHGMDVCSVHQRQFAHKAALEAEAAASRAVLQRQREEEEAETERRREIVSQSVTDVARQVGVPFVREREKWGRRKGKPEHVSVGQDYIDGEYKYTSVTIPMDVYTAIVKIITGNDLVLDKPRAPEPEVPPAPPVVMEGVVNPFE